MEEKRLLYRSPNHAANLNNMRLNNKWCDVTIRVDEVEFRAHKVVLAANLKYFDTMLSNDSFQESKQDIIPIQSLRGADLEAFVSYAYTGEILLTDSNVLNLFIAADYLGEDGIKDACIDFLKKHLKAEEACRAYKFAASINCVSLKNIAKKTIISNFGHCSQSTDYLDFDYEHLADVFSDGKAQPAESQQKFFEGIVKWIMHDVRERTIRMDELFSSVDITKVTSDYLIDFLYENMVDYNDEYGVIKDIMFSYRTNKHQQIKNQVANVEPTLAVIGLIKQKLSFQMFDFTKKKCSVMEEFRDFQSDKVPKGAILNNKLYYTTEEAQQTYLNVFDFATKCNTKTHSTVRLLKITAVCACDRYLYLCGGINVDNSRSQQVLRYDPLTNSFETLAPMGTKRSSASAVFYRGCLHVLGGCDRPMEAMSSVEKYNPDTKEWTAFSSMCERRLGHAVAVLDGKLYACGGYNTNSVEIYDPSTNCWQLIGNMNKQRSHFLVVVREKKLWAIGGDGEATVEVFDTISNKWQMDHEFSSGLRIVFPQGGLISHRCIPNVD